MGLIVIVDLMGSNCRSFLNAALCFYGSVLIYEENFWKLHFMRMETRQPQYTADLLFL